MTDQVSVVEPQTALAMFDHRVATDPDAILVITPDGIERSYAQVEHAVGRLAAALANAGVGPGDSVLLYLWNDPAWVVATLATWRMGATIIACGGQSQPAEAARRAEKLGARVVVIADDLELTGIGTSIVVGPEGDTVAGAGTVVRPAQPGPDECAAVFFTSGTTGEPKPVRLSHAAVAAAPRTTAAAYSRSADFRPRTAPAAAAPAVSFNPFGHLATLGRVVFRIYVGRPVVLVRKFNAEVMHSLAGRYPFDTLQLTPAMIHMLAFSDIDIELGSLRYVTAGTAPLPVATRDAFEARYGVPVLVAYGSTEGTVTALERFDDVMAGRRGPGSVGRVAEGTEFRIVDEDSHDVAPGDRGELLGRPRPGSDVAIDGQGWHHTGDLAHLDGDGILYIAGRLDDMMIVGGFNVDPGQIEDVLRSHPAIRDAVVVAAADERLGEVPIAGVVPAAGSIDTDDLAAFCRDSIEAYKVPRRWRVLDELPLTANGKLDRRAAAAALRSPTADVDNGRGPR